MTSALPKPEEHEFLPTDLPKEIPAHTGKPHSHIHHESMSVKTLLSWHAPGRPFKKRGKEFYINVLLIMLLTQVILFLFAQYMLMLVVFSLVFMAFALVTVPPAQFHYRISTEGLTVEDHFFLWQELYDFYFKRQYDMYTLHIRTHAFVPGEVIIPLSDMDKEHVKSVLIRYLPFREYIKPTFMEKTGDWLARNFPLDKTSTHPS